jgi:hypothetical protein
MALAERRGGMAEAALSQINTAFEVMRDGGEARFAEYYEGQLPKARALIARLPFSKESRGYWHGDGVLGAGEAFTDLNAASSRGVDMIVPLGRNEAGRQGKRTGDHR